MNSYQKLRLKETKEFVAELASKVEYKTTGYLGVNYSDYDKDDLINIIHILHDRYMDEYKSGRLIPMIGIKDNPIKPSTT